MAACGSFDLTSVARRENASRIEGLGMMVAAGLYRETPFGDVYFFYVNVTLTRR
jgi:hypothetical protein